MSQLVTPMEQRYHLFEGSGCTHIGAEAVRSMIRSNLPGRVVLRTASEADSIVVLAGDKKQAAYLLGKGSLIYQLGSTLDRLQSLLATIIELPQS